MNKDYHSILQDENLREALRQDEAALPQMSADLNDRLMKRLHHEERHRYHRVWPWVAAACVAAVIVVLLMSPKENGGKAMTDSGELTAQTGSITTQQDPKISQQEARDITFSTTTQNSQKSNPVNHSNQIAKTTERKQKKEATTPDMLAQPSSPVSKVHSKKHCETAQNTKGFLAQEKTADQPKEATASDEIAPADLPRTQAKPQQVVLTERDIPISRPENYHYTPEELALMRRQANEAYLKWMELELEIMKYQYEQVAKQ